MGGMLLMGDARIMMPGIFGCQRRSVRKACGQGWKERNEKADESADDRGRSGKNVVHAQIVREGGKCS